MKLNPELEARLTPLCEQLGRVLNGQQMDVGLTALCITILNAIGYDPKVPEPTFVASLREGCKSVASATFFSWDALGADAALDRKPSHSTQPPQ